MSNNIKLSEWAKKNGITYRTAWNWFRLGKMPCNAVQLPSKAIIVEDVPIVKSFNKED